MNTTTFSSDKGSIESVARDRARSRRRWLVVLTAMASAIAVWTLAVPFAGIELDVETGGSVRSVSHLAVTVTSLTAGLVAWVGLTVLERFVRRSRGVWTGLALGVFLVSLTGPFAGTSPAAVAALLLLHATVAGVLVVGLRRTA